MVSFVRTIIMYGLVIFAMRCMGKRQIGQLQPYEFVIALMISDLAALPMQDGAIPLWSGVIPILTLLLLQITISFFVMKSKRIRTFLCGKPCVLVKSGSIIEANLRNQMYNLDDLLEALRLQGYPNVNDVLLAILENNGNLSILPYSKVDTIRREDMSIQAPEGVITDLIVGGVALNDNIEMTHLSRSILLQEIEKAGAKRISDVFYCYMDAKGTVYTQLKEKIQCIRTR